MLCLAGIMAGCGGSGIVTTKSGNPGTGNPGSSNPGSSTTFDCDGQWMWGGNYQGIASSGGSPFVLTGNLTYPRAGHTATLLKDGTVLVVGGGQLDVDDLLVSISSAEVYDPARGQFTALKSCSTPVEFQAATLLTDGEVLLTGGNEFLGYPTWLPAISAGELYNPATLKFTPTGSMSISRTHHTSTLLPDGRVLIAGGATSVGSGADTTWSPSASAEIYNPLSGSFTRAAEMTTQRTAHTATLLPSGKVLIAGGENNQGAIASAELYDPKSNTFVATGTMTTARTGHAATLLASGKVLITGGAPDNSILTGLIAISAEPQPTAEVYDPETGTFSPAAPMATGRLAHTATLLADGRVLIVGGFKSWAGRYESSSSAEIYDPASNAFNSVGAMNATRFWHSATPLPDGSVLIVGGIGGDEAQASAEIFKY